MTRWEYAEMLGCVYFSLLVLVLGTWGFVEWGLEGLFLVDGSFRHLEALLWVIE